jgi:hypothetical protein
MSVTGNGARLAAVTRELAARWGETRQSWRDAKAEEFERHYLAELLASVDRTVTVIEKIDKVIEKIRKDCE